MIDQPLISLAGDIGSGKSTVGRIVADALKAPYTSTGDMQRAVARSLGITTLQLNERCMKDPGLDRRIDDHLRALGCAQRAGVVDARLGWFFIPQSFKVFLSVDPAEAARRTSGAARAEEDNSDAGAVMKNNIARRQLENRRFLQLYGADCALLRNYDLAIDTTYVDARHVAGVVLAEYAALAQGRKGPVCLLSPKRLLPTHPIREVSEDACAEVASSIRSRGFDRAEPVVAIASEWFFAIVDGHKRTSCALKAGVPLIPCDTKPLDGELSIQGLSARQFVRDGVKRAWLCDWEAAHGFRFLSYPNPELGVEGGR
jgi:cytidylate kinase